jgi:hypothetical protein
MNDKKIEVKEDILNDCIKILCPEDKYSFDAERIWHALQKLNTIDLHALRMRLIVLCKT